MWTIEPGPLGLPDDQDIGIVRALRCCVVLHPGRDWAWMLPMIPTRRRLEYANGYLLLGMVQEAAGELAQIGREDVQKPEVRAAMVDLHLAQGNWALMAEGAEGLAADNPDEAQWWVHWAYALRELQLVKEAKVVALRGLERHSDEPILHFNLACYLSLLGEYDPASDHLNRAISLDERFQEESVQDPDLAGLWAWFSEGQDGKAHST